MSSNQAKMLIDDLDDDVTQPGNACLPTRLIAFEEAQLLGPSATDEEYYRHLAAALDDALNLQDNNAP